MASIDFVKIAKSSLSGTVVHFDESLRLYKHHSNKDINPELSHLNYNLTFHNGLISKNKKTWKTIMNDAIKHLAEVDAMYPPERIKKDRKEFDYIYIPCPLAIERDGRADEFFAKAYQLMGELIGEEHVHGMQIHYDEKHTYLDHGQQKESLLHGHCLVSAYAEWQDAKGRERYGINSKHFNTKSFYKKAQKEMQRMVMQEFAISYQTGDYARKGKTVEQLKWESDREKYKTLDASLIKDFEGKKEALDNEFNDLHSTYMEQLILDKQEAAAMKESKKKIVELEVNSYIEDFKEYIINQTNDFLLNKINSEIRDYILERGLADDFENWMSEKIQEHISKDMKETTEYTLFKDYIEDEEEYER